ncbi:hypothetical protein ESCO_006171 [Escovopsis weberi]|uniref:Uncharacterized protein n=1 Tax=Escovopsis weberi TaxID=150374 RepID=A0A0M8N3W3_ESCWE|nr:hypothetical protein ESCO_006171 [Escovopsis weberi]
MDDDDDLFGALPLMITSDLNLGLAPAPPLEHLAGGNDSAEEEQDAHRAWAEAVISQKLDDGQVVEVSDDLMDGPAGDDEVEVQAEDDNDDDDFQLLQQLEQDSRREGHQEIPEEAFQEDVQEIPEEEPHEIPDEDPQDRDPHLPSRFEIAIPSAPEELLVEYEEVYSSIVEQVLGSRGSGPRGRLYQVEFTDGREGMIIGPSDAKATISGDPIPPEP